ncbi:Translocase of chloroplast 159, chloroplastic, partial [Mucuna pruriens]
MDSVNVSLPLLSDSDNDGFVSGDEESDFEAQPTGPILVKSPLPVLNPSLDSPSDEAHRPIAKVTQDDDDDDVLLDHDDRHLQALKDADFIDSNEVFVEASGGADDHHKEILSAVSVDNNAVESTLADRGFERGLPVQFNDKENEDGGFEGAVGVELNDKDEKEKEEDADKGFEEAVGMELNDKEKEEEVVDEKVNQVLLSQEGDGGTNHSDSVLDEKKGEGVVVENDDGGVTDSVVDTVQVNLLGSGVAVVGDEVDVEESEVKGLDVPAPAMSLDNGFDPIEEGGKDVIGKVVDGGDGPVVDAQSGAEDVIGKVVDGGDDPGVDGHSGAEVVLDGDDESGKNEVVGDGLKSGIVVPLEEGDGSEFASRSVKVEQDEIKMEGDVVEGEIGSNVEEGNVVEGEIGGNVEEGNEGNVEGEISSNVEEGEEQVGHHGDRQIDGLVSGGKIGSHMEEVGSYGDREINGSVSDEKGEEVVFGSTDAANKFLDDLELQQSGAGGSLQDVRIDGQIVTDSDEEEETDDEGDGKELFDTATLAALLKAASGADQDGGSITITSQDGSRLFSVERPAGLGSALQSGKPAMRPTRPNLFTPSISRPSAISDSNLSEEEKKKLEKLQEVRVKYLRLVSRLGFTTEESIAAQVLYRLTLVAGRQSGQMFSLDAAKETASKLEAEGRDDLDFSVNVLVLGKAGVGKSATINSIFGETKTSINACGPATTAVTEIVGVVDGMKMRVFDTPGLKSSAIEQNFNTKVLSAVKKLTKKYPLDIVLYVDRLDLQTRDMNDLPMLRSITSVLGSSIWRNVIVTLTHAASAPPDGPSGAPLSYDVFVAQRSHIVQQTIGQALGDLRLMNPSLMNPVSLVENHPSCRKNRDGEKVLPNGQSWRPLLLLLCYSMKILSDAGNATKTQESFDHRRLFGFRSRSAPLPYLLSWLLQSRTYPKLPADQGGADNGDSDTEMADLSDSDLDEDEDEYDQLPPFKPMKKAQIAMLTREQQKAYLEEYDYRVKLLQKKQWREELRRVREMKKKGNSKENDYGYMEEDDQENGSPAAVPVPLPDMALPPSFDSDNPAYRYRFLEPTSQLLTRPVLDNHGWDHDCGYDGVNIEQSLAIINKFPAAVTVQVTKDKKDFTIHLDSSVAAKLGEYGSSMAGFDIQNIGKQLAYIVRGDTKFKNFKRNKTAAGVSVTFLGENVSTGVKIEDQIAVGKRLVLVGSTGIVKSQTDSACGANLEVRVREADFPIGQDQSSLSLSLVKWRGDLALGANLQSQISIGRSYKIAVRAGLNNKLSGQITVRTSSSDQLQIALIAILPIAKAIYKNFWPGASENYSIY